MKRTLFIILTACSIVVLQQASAQKPDKKKTTKAVKQVAKVHEVDVTLGHSSLKGGAVSKKVFDSLLKQGIMVAGGGNVEGFMFAYSERNYYEDSVGNPIRVMDYWEEFCPGNQLTDAVKESIFYRTKPGDTAYMERIKVKMPDGTEGKGRSMKFAITGGRN